MTSLSSIQLAIATVGGPTKTAHLLGVSNATIHNWVKQGYVSKPFYALRLAQATGINYQTLLDRSGTTCTPTSP